MIHHKITWILGFFLNDSPPKRYGKHYYYKDILNLISDIGVGDCILFDNLTVHNIVTTTIFFV
jgi:hypothetical protein